MQDILDPKLNPNDYEEVKIEKSLRPQNFDEMIGREKEKMTLKIMIESSRSRGEPIDHVIFHGPPGLGKTSFATVIANEMKAQMHTTSGPAIERAGDLVSIITNLQAGDILFIDEIHRLNKVVEEILYPAMEDFAVDIILGKGAGAKSVRIDLPKFTVIGATTKIGAVSAPLRDRFGNAIHLDFYEVEDLSEMLKQKAKILNIKLSDDCSVEIAKRGRGTARIAIRLLKRVRDFAIFRGNKNAEGHEITKQIIADAMGLLDIDINGLDHMDRKVLSIIKNDFSGGPVGLSTLSASLMEEMETIESVIEPYLIKLGLLKRTPKGRELTEKGQLY